MKVIVTGAGGHIGTYLIPMLVDAGYEVTTVTRHEPKPYEWNPAWNCVNKVFMDRAAEPDFAEKIAAMGSDIVVDLINFTLEDTKAMAQALKKTKCSHYLFCSSCWAHGISEVLPLDPDDLKKQPIDEYGKNKFASELYLKELYRSEGFPATIIMPGQIAGPGWNITGPWANIRYEPFQMAADGAEIKLPNFGMETIHHVHGYDVAQVFFKAIIHRNQALGESFDAQSGGAITLYGYAKLLFEFFGKEPKIRFLPWEEWKKYVLDLTGDEHQIQESYCHMVRSAGAYSIAKEERLLDYHPKYTNVQCIKLAVQSYVDRGLIKISR